MCYYYFNPFKIYRGVPVLSATLNNIVFSQKKKIFTCLLNTKFNIPQLICFTPVTILFLFFEKVNTNVFIPADKNNFDFRIGQNLSNLISITPNYKTFKISTPIMEMIVWIQHISLGIVFCKNYVNFMNIL